MSNVRPQMEPIFRTTQSELQTLEGLAVDAVFQDAGYWHLVVALRCTNGKSITFTTEDVGVAKYFEVFPLRISVQLSEHREWLALGHDQVIQKVRPLWRHEWLEPTEPHPEMVGGPPHLAQYTGRGPVPATAVAQAVVQAGVELVFNTGGSMVVHASDTAPLNVELAATKSEVRNALSKFSETAA